MCQPFLRAYCHRDVQLTAEMTRVLSALPSFTWLCEHLDQWHIVNGRISVKPQFKTP